MEFPIISKSATQWTTVALAFLASSLGFGAGWVAHQGVMNRMLQMRPYTGSAQRGPIMSTNDLAPAEAECPGARTAIIAETPYQFRVDRRALACLLSAPSTRARLAPNLLIAPAGLEPAKGFRIWDVRPGSLPARLGLKNGDMIRGLNGVSLSSPQSVETAYARLRSASYVIVEIDRHSPQGRSRLQLRYRVSGGPV